MDNLTSSKLEPGFGLLKLEKGKSFISLGGLSSSFNCETKNNRGWVNVQYNCTETHECT